MIRKLANRPSVTIASTAFATAAQAQGFFAEDRRPPRPPADIPYYYTGPNTVMRPDPYAPDYRVIQSQPLPPPSYGDRPYYPAANDTGAPIDLLPPNQPLPASANDDAFVPRTDVPVYKMPRGVDPNCTPAAHYCVPVPQNVPFTPPPQAVTGDIVIDTMDRRLYLLLGNGMARRYVIAVGKDGSKMPDGRYTISRKAENPDWIPLPSMHEEFAARGKKLADRVPGGTPQNPLGVRAIYIDKKGEYYRIHGTSEPWEIGKSVSHGCFRMENEDVMDLYDRIPIVGDNNKLSIHLFVINGAPNVIMTPPEVRRENNTRRVPASAYQNPFQTFFRW